MSATVVDKTIFGARGVSIPTVFEPGFVGLKRRINFNVANVTGGTAYAFVAIPKKFVVTGVLVKEFVSPMSGGESTRCASGTVDLFIADPTDSSQNVSIGNTATTVGGDTMADQLQTVGNVGVDANTLVCLKSSVAQKGGGIEVTIIGYTPDGDSVESFDIGDVSWVNGQTEAQFIANISGGDPYTANAEGTPIYPVGNDQ